MSKAMTSVLVALLCMASLPGIAVAQDTSPAQVYVIIDMTGESPRAIGFCGESKDKCSTNQDRPSITDSLVALVNHSPKSSRLRAAITAGAKIQAIVLYNLADSPSLTLSESPRSSRIASDIRTVLASLGKVKAVPEKRDTVAHLIKSVTLHEVRGTVSITAKVVNTKSDTLAFTYAVTTGPEEHWFMSGNVDGTFVRQGSLDTANAISPRKPSAFFLALNYAVTDLYLPAPDQSLEGLLKSLYFGLIVQADRRPFDQIGVTMGLRHNPIPCLKDVVDFRTVSLYTGVLWQQDGVRASYRKQGWVWGVSVDLSKATAWLSDTKP